MDTFRSSASIPGCDQDVLDSAAVLMRTVEIPRHVRPISDREIASLQAQMDAYAIQQQDYECRRAILAFEGNEKIKDLRPPSPPDNLSDAQSVLDYHAKHKKPGTEPEIQIAPPVQFRLLKKTGPFRLPSVIPAHVTIPFMSVTARTRNEQLQQELSKRLLRLEALDQRRKQKRTQTLSKIDREKRAGNSGPSAFCPKMIPPVNLESLDAPEDDMDDARSAVEDIDKFERRMKLEAARKRAKTIFASSVAPPSLPG
jgi:hypothetical protein